MIRLTEIDNIRCNIVKERERNRNYLFHTDPASYIKIEDNDLLNNVKVTGQKEVNESYVILLHMNYICFIRRKISKNFSWIMFYMILSVAIIIESFTFKPKSCCILISN